MKITDLNRPRARIAYSSPLPRICHWTFKRLQHCKTIKVCAKEEDLRVSSSEGVLGRRRNEIKMPGISSEESRLRLLTCDMHLIKILFRFPPLSWYSYSTRTSNIWKIYPRWKRYSKKWKGVERFQFLCFISSPAFIWSNYQDFFFSSFIFSAFSIFLLQRNDIKSVVVLKKPSGVREGKGRCRRKKAIWILENWGGIRKEIMENPSVIWCYEISGRVRSSSSMTTTRIRSLKNHLNDIWILFRLLPLSQEVWIHLKLSTVPSTPYRSILFFFLAFKSQVSPSHCFSLDKPARGSMQTILKFEALLFSSGSDCKLSLLSYLAEFVRFAFLPPPFLSFFCLKSVLQDDTSGSGGQVVFEYFLDKVFARVSVMGAISY